MAKKPARSVFRESANNLRMVRDLGPQYGVQFIMTPSLGILAGKIDKLGMDIRSFREPLHRSVKQVMVPSIKKNFEREGRPRKWKALAPYTKEVKAAGGYPDTILERTGLLGRTAGQINIWTINQTSATIRDLPEKIGYGKVHQAGYVGSGSRTKGLKAIQAAQRKAMRTGKAMSTRAAPTIPARPMFLMHPKDEKDIQKVFTDWLAERADKHWAKL